MSSNTTLRNLLRDLEKYADYADGFIDETELPVEVVWIGSGKPRPNGDPPGFLVVPHWPMSTERWEAIGANADAIAATRESRQAWYTDMGLEFKPEPERTSTESKPAPTSQSLRHAADKNPRPNFKSLAARLLRR